VNGQLAIDFAACRRDLGIARAADHAGDRWAKVARGYLLEWLATHAGDFMAEDFREWALERGCDSPPDARAWGHAMKSAKNDGLIRCVGYALANSSNRSPKCQWVRA